MKQPFSILSMCILVFASSSSAQEQSPHPSPLTPIRQEPLVEEFTPRPPLEPEPQAETAAPVRTASADDQDGDHSIEQVKTTSMIVNFRQPEWQNFNARDQRQAQHTIETLQSIGIDATSAEAEGHFEVRFQCPNWKSIKVDTNQQLVQWQQYLDLIGIDTVALNPPESTNLPTVSFKLPKPRTAHLKDKSHVDALVETFGMLGCQVSANDHDGHFDLSLQCDDWRTISLTSEESAHVWQDWLNQNGFETRHTSKQ